MRNRACVVVASLVIAVVLAACGGSSSSGPKDVFSGTWVGLAGSDTETLVVTQTAGSVSGNGTQTGGGGAPLPYAVTGTVSGTSVVLTFDAGGGDTLHYAGTFASPTVVNGTASASGVSAPLTFNKTS